MRSLSIGEKLGAITTLNLRSGIKREDYIDARAWLEQAGPKVDTSALPEKAVMRIIFIYDQFFE